MHEWSSWHTALQTEIRLHLRVLNHPSTWMRFSLITSRSCLILLRCFSHPLSLSTVIPLYSTKHQPIAMSSKSMLFTHMILDSPVIGTTWFLFWRLPDIFFQKQMHLHYESPITPTQFFIQVTLSYSIFEQPDSAVIREMDPWSRDFHSFSMKAMICTLITRIYGAKPSVSTAQTASVPILGMNVGISMAFSATSPTVKARIPGLARI